MFSKVVIVVLNQKEGPQRTTKIKLFINNYN